LINTLVGPVDDEAAADEILGAALANRWFIQWVMVVLAALRKASSCWTNKHRDMEGARFDIVRPTEHQIQRG
jgi:hypothetical protein